MNMMMTCSQESRAGEEQLAGTFKPADTFFLIASKLAEYGGWQGEIAKTVARSGQLAPIMRHLSQVPRAKTLFIRRPGADGKDFYVAFTNQPQPRIYHAVLADYDDLLSLDVKRLNGGAPTIQGLPMREVRELFTVCTNGRHDPCCAKHGVPFYQALVEQVGENKVWQTTHIGGHRMAATMIAFPQGIVYGHLDPADAEAVAINQRGGSLLTHKYRGRGAYPGHQLAEEAHQAACAAEAHLRDSQRLYALDALHLSEVLPADGDRYIVTFARADGQRHSLEVATELSTPRPTSCGDEPAPMPQHVISA